MAFFEVCLVVVSAVAAFDCGVKAWLALGRAGRSSAGMEVGWVVPSTDSTVGIVFAFGGIVAKG